MSIQEARAVASAIAVVGNDGVIAKRVLLLPMGEFEGRGHGRKYLLKDQAHAEAVVAATRQRLGATDAVVDYDHQSIFGAQPGVGGQAPAAGWIKPASLQASAEGVWGEVEWTEAASAKLGAREYRYLSPVFGFDKATGRVQRLLNVALTNTPAIEELPAVASAAGGLDPADQGLSMSLKAIATAMGLADTATEAEIVTAIQARQTTATAIATALGKPDATSAELIAAASAVGAAGNPDPAKFVPIAAFTELQGQVTALTAGAAERSATEAVAAATAAGKIAPAEAQQKWALDYAKKDPEGFDAYVAAATAIVTPGKRQADPPPAEITALTAEQKAICTGMGLSEADFLATLKEQV